MNKRQMKIEVLKSAADLLEIALEEGAIYSKSAPDKDNLLYQNLLEEIAINLRRRAAKMEHHSDDKRAKL